ncbi:hypothetical protein TcBrA4_0137230 [Trypanosoma cruzi]|nr:hypothetical protein TcBrA4_0137230 [Trypanosoma cruzi]
MYTERERTGVSANDTPLTGALFNSSFTSSVTEFSNFSMRKSSMGFNSTCPLGDNWSFCSDGKSIRWKENFDNELSESLPERRGLIWLRRRRRLSEMRRTPVPSSTLASKPSTCFSPFAGRKPHGNRHDLRGSSSSPFYFVVERLITFTLCLLVLFFFILVLVY